MVERLCQTRGLLGGPFIIMSKAVLPNNLSKGITRIEAATLLIWGLRDTATLLRAEGKLQRLVSTWKLAFTDKHCQVSMMDRPENFIALIDKIFAAP